MSVVDRVKQEKKELDEKVARLGVFFKTKEFADDVSDGHKVLLKTQVQLMRSYSDILGLRIEDLS